MIDGLKERIIWLIKEVHKLGVQDAAIYEIRFGSHTSKLGLYCFISAKSKNKKDLFSLHIKIDDEKEVP